MYRMTLREWQTKPKPREEILYNCSEHSHLNDEWVPFSIGMGYSIIGYPRDLTRTQVGPHDKLVMCALNPMTDMRRRPTGINRRTIMDTLVARGIHNNRYNMEAYFSVLPQYKFVISPEGNGIDCHRHYEALMAGCIPVVEDHPGIREKYAGCPVLYTTDYSECTPEYLNAKYEEMIDKEYDFSKLILSTYSPEDQAQIRDNGNYWSTRLTGRRWY
jgi:hypothetical protein